MYLLCVLMSSIISMVHARVRLVLMMSVVVQTSNSYANSLALGGNKPLHTHIPLGLNEIHKDKPPTHSVAMVHANEIHGFILALGRDSTPT